MNFTSGPSGKRQVQGFIGPLGSMARASNFASGSSKGTSGMGFMPLGRVQGVKFHVRAVGMASGSGFYRPMRVDGQGREFEAEP